jgi:hypothetical protein
LLSPALSPHLVALTHHPSYSQGKARLGTVVHKKTATALALTAVKNEDQREFAKLVESFKVRRYITAGQDSRHAVLYRQASQHARLSEGDGRGDAHSM